MKTPAASKKQRLQHHSRNASTCERRDPPSVLKSSTGTSEYSLNHVTLDTAPQFFALSYAWNDPSLFSEVEAGRKYNIRVDGIEVAIGVNLSAALKAWREHASSHIPLWVDSLCIDQQNIAERSEQVLRMYSIYEKARVVIVWLGPESNKSDLAWDFMSIFTRKAREHEWVRRSIRERVFSSEWKAVDHLLRRSWWRRVWIIQEMVAANEILFMCGQRTIQSEVVLLFFAALIALHATYSTPLVQEEGVELDGDSITLGNIYLRPYAWARRPLLQTLYTTGKSLASDNRDKIYAILGLSSDSYQIMESPDYSLTVEEVYKQFAVRFVSKYQSLEFLSFAGLPVFPRRSGTALPSWIPDWSRRKCATLNSTIRPATLTNAAREYQAQAEFSADREKLTARGICVDVVDGLAYSVWGARSKTSQFEVQQTKSQETEYKPALSTLDAISETLVASSTPANESVSVFLEKCRESVATETKELDPTSTGPALFNEWYQQNRSFIIAGKALEAWVQSVQWTTINSSINEHARERYVNKLFIQSRNRRFFTTTMGYMGLGVNSALPGDLVCVLFGCSTPVLLRRVQEHYMFLGEAYLHGVMNGQAIDGLERGEFFEKTFCIW
jgi:hypothetical protein